MASVVETGTQARTDGDPAERPGALGLSGRPWRWPAARLEQAAASWRLALLRRRGLLPTDQALEQTSAHDFLAPSLTKLACPSALADMAPALARLLRARKDGEQIWIYGDYDVDGVAATAILLRALRALGLRADYYIPHRQKEGYGLNAQALATLAERGGLLVTVDCGSTSVQELAAARAAGLEAIVIDHHQLGPERPDIVALINPQRPDCGFAEGVLCAAGLAFMVVVALRRALRQEEPSGPAKDYDVRTLLDLVAVATVADMVPLMGQNRLLTHAGLLRLQRAPQLGLAALCAVAGVDRAHLDASHLGFRLGPRINARGRMEHAGLGVELFVTEDPARARHIAQSLNEANEQRRALEKATVAAALAQVEAGQLLRHNVLVLHQQDWHPGILGLVASRLMQLYHRPAVVVGEGGKGSARSVPGFHLVAALTECQAHLLRFGGHPAAAGLTAAPAELPALTARLHDLAAAALGPAPYTPPWEAELEVGGASCFAGLLRDLDALAPFGKAHEPVVLAARNVTLVSARRVGEDHLKAVLQFAHSDSRLEAIGFGMGQHLGRLPAALDVLFYLERNVFRGEVRLQARLCDLRATAWPTAAAAGRPHPAANDGPNAWPARDVADRGAPWPSPSANPSPMP